MNPGDAALTLDDLNTKLASSTAPVEMLRLNEFSPALPASPNEAAEMRRRFETLLLPLDSAAHVYKALNARGHELAVKVLMPVRPTVGNGLTEEQAAEKNRIRAAAFFEEYRSLVTLMHLKGFPQVYGMGQKGEALLILMEWVEGVALADLMPQLPVSILTDADGTRRRCVDPAVVANLELSMLRVLRGTQALEHTFVHRDLSPRNILVRTSRRPLAEQLTSGDFDVVLVDLGSALVQREGEPGFAARQGIWRYGTAEYAAPEMLTRDMADVEKLRHSETVDTYALCSITYQMLTGCTPFGLSARTDVSPHLAKLHETPAELTCAAQGAGLLRVALRGMSAPQSERYSLDALDAAIRAWQANTNAADASAE